MQFGYGGSLGGGAGSVLTNNGTIRLGSSNASPRKDGTLVHSVFVEHRHYRQPSGHCGAVLRLSRTCHRQHSTFARDRWCPRGWCRIVPLPCCWFSPGAA
jgi:hypothetical protein